MSKGNNVSIFEKYHNYSKEVILISIKVLTPEERISIKNKYGSDFLGDGYLLRSEETRFAWAEKSLEEKLEKVQKMVDSGYSEEYIISNLKKIYNLPYKTYSDNLKAPQLVQLKGSFIENFPPNVQPMVEKYLSNLSSEEKSLISEFYWGKKFEILKKDVDKRKIPALKKLMNMIQDKYIYHLQKHVNQKDKQHPIKKSYKKDKQQPTKEPDQKGEQQLIKEPEKRFNQLKISPKNTKQYKQGFLTFFEEGKAEEVLKIVDGFQDTNINYYELIHKIYSGERLETRNNIKLGGQEKSLLNNVKLKIRKILSGKEPEKRFNQQKVSKNKKVKQSKKDFLTFFGEEKAEEVLKIVENFQVTNPNYYEVIHKRYSGERLEIRNHVNLSKQENIILNNAKVKIRKILSGKETKKIFNQQKVSKHKNVKQSKKGFLTFFEKEKSEEVLKIVENFQVTNPNYYEVIHKLYSGERLETRNDIILNMQEKNSLKNAKVKIKSLLKKDIKNKVHAIEDIILFLPKIIQENSIFYYIETIREKIFKIVSIDDIVDYYILHLSDFYETDIVEILKVIATYKSEKIETVMNSSYIKEKLQFLTPKEQMYFYLKLKSYNTNELTNKKISEILNIEESFLEQYRIMTIDEETNQLNQIIKNKNR